MKISVHASQPYAPSLPDSATMAQPAARLEQDESIPEPLLVQEQAPTPAPAAIEKAWILQAALAVSSKVTFDPRSRLDYDD